MVLRCERDERQPELVCDETHLGQRPFDGDGIRFDEQPAMERQEPVVGRPSTRDIAISRTALCR